MRISPKYLVFAFAGGCCRCIGAVASDVAAVAVAVLVGRNFVATNPVKDFGSDSAQSVQMNSQATSFRLVGDCCSSLGFAMPDFVQ